MAMTAFFLMVRSSVKRSYAVEQTVDVSLELEQDLRLRSLHLFHLFVELIKLLADLSRDHALLHFADECRQV